MSSDQLTYVLVALFVTGLAILLLLAGAFVARRGSRAERAAPASAAPAPAAQPALPVYEAPLPVEPAVAPAAPPLAARAAAPPSSAPLAATPAEEPDGPGLGIEPVADAEVGQPPEEPLAVTAADLAAAARRVHDPREEEIIEGFLSISPRRREVAAAQAVRPPTAVAPAAGAVQVEEPAPPATPDDPYVDETTGLDSPAAWDRAVAEENARYVRYRRPVSVVVGELDGLVRFEDQFGVEAGHRVLGAVGGAMRRGARRTDLVAHAGGGRFLVLMPETDEIQAINYVERVRAECERWLQAGSASLRLSMGWASPSAVGELDTALRTAEERMYAERRRSAHAGTNGPGASR